MSPPASSSSVSSPPARYRTFSTPTSAGIRSLTPPLSTSQFQSISQDSHPSRLSEYSPLIGFNEYYNPTRSESPSIPPWRIYVRLFSALGFATLLLLIGGIFVFRSRFGPAPSDLSPVIFVPDLFCSELEIRLRPPTTDNTTPTPNVYPTVPMADGDASAPSFPADSDSLTFDERRSLSPSLRSCPRFLLQWTSIRNTTLQQEHADCLLEALKMDYNPDSHQFVNRLGIEIRSVYRQGTINGLIINQAQENEPPEGSSGQASDSSSSPNSPCSYGSLFHSFHRLGYREHKNLHSLTYDWRKSSSALNVPNVESSTGIRFSGSFYSRLMSLIEYSVSKNNRRVVLVTHGAGADHAITFLRLQSQQWKRVHVAGMVAIGSDFGGTLENLASLSGIEPRASAVLPVSSYSSASLRSFFQSLEYFPYKLPLPSFWSSNQHSILVESPRSQYTAAIDDVEDYLQRIGAKNARDLYKFRISPVIQSNSLAEIVSGKVDQLLNDIRTQLPALITGDESLHSMDSSSSSFTHSLFDLDSSGNSFTSISLSDLNFLSINPYFAPSVSTLAFYPSNIPALQRLEFLSEDFREDPKCVWINPIAQAAEADTDASGADSAGKRSDYRDSKTSKSFVDLSSEAELERSNQRQWRHFFQKRERAHHRHSRSDPSSRAPSYLHYTSTGHSRSLSSTVLTSLDSNEESQYYRYHSALNAPIGHPAENVFRQWEMQLKQAEKSVKAKKSHGSTDGAASGEKKDGDESEPEIQFLAEPVSASISALPARPHVIRAIIEALTPEPEDAEEELAEEHQRQKEREAEEKHKRQQRRREKMN